MEHQEDHALQPFWNLAAAPMQVRAVELALEHGLFPQLAEAASAEQVAEVLGWRPEATAVWLDLLWSLGLLVRTGETTPCYQRSALATRHFLAAAEGDCGEAWRYRVRTLGRIAAQMESLLNGTSPSPLPAESQPTPDGWAQAAQAQIGQEQRVVSVPQLLQCLDRLGGLPEQGRFLDLGGGPGFMAQALARHLPQWRGVVCDLPETVAVARSRLTEAGLAERIDCLAADLDHDDFGGNYDLIWCSSVLHFLAEPLALLARLRAALRPGGRLLIAHAEQDSDPAVAAGVLPFYAPMLLRGKYVPRPGEIEQALLAAGFQPVTALGRLSFPMAPVRCYDARRA